MTREISKAAFGNLNLVRALSGLIVVLSHFFQLFVLPVTERGRGVDWAIASAEYAVLTFFCLSGFLIALSIDRNLDKHGRFEWRQYLVSRAARIYPALIASVLLCILLYYALQAMGLGDPGSIPRTSDINPPSRTEFSLVWSEVVHTLAQTYAFGPGGYISSNGPLWSLSYEVGFYLYAGLLMTLIKGRGAARWVAMALLVLVAAIGIAAGKHLFLHFGTIWLLGVGLFFALKGPNPVAASAGSSARYRRNLILMFLALGLLNVPLALSGLEGAFLEGFLASAVLLLFLYLASRFRRPVLGGLARMADSTYTLYLFHFPIMLAAYVLIRDLHEASRTLYFTVALACTIALIPACHLLAKFLENRRLWESVLNWAVSGGGYPAPTDSKPASGASRKATTDPRS